MKPLYLIIETVKIKRAMPPPPRGPYVELLVCISFSFCALPTWMFSSTCTSLPSCTNCVFVPLLLLPPTFLPPTTFCRCLYFSGEYFPLSVFSFPEVSKRHRNHLKHLRYNITLELAGTLDNWLTLLVPVLQGLMRQTVKFSKMPMQRRKGKNDTFLLLHGLLLLLFVCLFLLYPLFYFARKLYRIPFTNYICPLPH